MTTSSDAHSEDSSNDKPEPGTALAPAREAGVGPFLAAANAAAPRGLGARLLDYSAHAAIIVGLIGFAWTVSSRLSTKPTAAQIEAPVKAASAEAPAPRAAPPVAPKVDELAQLREANHQMAVDIKALRANIDTLRSSAKRDKTPDEVRVLEADLKTVKSGIDSTKTQTDAALAQLSGKVDKLQHARLEQKSVDMTSTGSIGQGATTIAKVVPTPPVKPTSTKLASVEEMDAKPQVISGWVVRDVYDGVALIEGRRGPMEVVPGVSIPGAGVVKSISRHGNGWTVTTTKGQLAYAAPPRDYRRVNSRDYYPAYPGDY